MFVSEKIEAFLFRQKEDKKSDKVLEILKIYVDV